MQKKAQKQVISILLIVLFILSVTYIFLHLRNQNEVSENQKISTNFNGSKTITINSTLPISDELGKKLDGKGTSKGIQGYTEFTIKNNLNKNIEYQICIEKKELENEIRGNYIKFYLTDEADNPQEGYEKSAVPMYNDLPSLSNAPGLRLLSSGTLEKKESKKLILRSWLSDSYAISTEDNEFTFDIVVKAK